MAVWGLRIKELLAEQKKTPSWLAQRSGIARSTISNWLNNPNGVTPKPEHVAKVAKALGTTTRELAPYAGYPIINSSDVGERQARINAIAASPRLAKAAEDIAKELSARDQDTVLSMIETFISSRRAPKGS